MKRRIIIMIEFEIFNYEFGWNKRLNGLMVFTEKPKKCRHKTVGFTSFLKGFITAILLLILLSTL
jgi:hypothetical protein